VGGGGVVDDDGVVLGGCVTVGRPTETGAPGSPPGSGAHPDRARIASAVPPTAAATANRGAAGTGPGVALRTSQLWHDPGT
jgi:hypothetical protein